MRKPVGSAILPVLEVAHDIACGDVTEGNQ
jgi:hypothetical protein